MHPKIAKENRNQPLGYKYITCIAHFSRFPLDGIVHPISFWSSLYMFWRLEGTFMPSGTEKERPIAWPGPWYGSWWNYKDCFYYFTSKYANSQLLNDLNEQQSAYDKRQCIYYQLLFFLLILHISWFYLFKLFWNSLSKANKVFTCPIITAFTESNGVVLRALKIRCWGG